MQETTSLIIENAIKGDSEMLDSEKDELLCLIRERSAKAKKLITAAEACVILGCGRTYLSSLHKAGHIRCVKYSPHVIRYYADDVEHFKYSGQKMHTNN